MKTKELLALCVDRHGGIVTREEAIDILWKQSSLRKSRYIIEGEYGIFKNYVLDYCNTYSKDFSFVLCLAVF